MAHLSPAAIFSPSVAKKQLEAAKDWSYIDSWLFVKFDGKPPPSFERNNDTLKALLVLAASNESADEESSVMIKIEAKIQRELQETAASEPNNDLLNSLEENLTREGKTSLEALSNLSVVLNQPSPKTELLGRKLINLHIASDKLDQTSDRIRTLEAHLNDELENVNNLIGDLQSPAYQPSEDPAKQAIQYQRKIKEMSSKLPELREKVAKLPSNSEQSILTIQDVKSEEDNFKNVVHVVGHLEMEVKSYHCLPQDKNLARARLEAMRAELYDLARKRDSMFEGLVEN